jgi:hypothetical protein
VVTAPAPPRPRTIDVLAGLVRPFVIMLGFVSSLVGTLGSFLIIERVNVAIRALVDQKNGASQEIEKLGGLASAYFMANQQGDLIYMLGLQPGARKDLADLIYKGNLLDRAEPVRNVISALSLVRLLDYRQTYGEYEKLVEAAQKETTFAAFMAVKMFERKMVQQAQDRVSALQVTLVPLQRQISLTEAQLRARQIFLIAFSSVGAFLLLLANLFEHTARARPTSPDKGPAATETAETAAEKTTTENSTTDDQTTTRANGTKNGANRT